MADRRQPPPNNKDTRSLPNLPSTPPPQSAQDIHSGLCDARPYATPYSNKPGVYPSSEVTQTYKKMGGSLIEEVFSGTFVDVPNLIEDKLSDHIISMGIGHAKYPNDPVAAAKYEFKASETLDSLKEEGTYGRYKKWVGWKRGKKDHEKNVTDYLNKIAENIRQGCGLPSNDTTREFSCMFKDKAPAEAAVNCKRKPDGVVIDHSKVDTDAAWADIHAVMEFKRSRDPRAYRTAYAQLLQYARMVFAAQQNRRFVLGVILTGDDLMTFFVFDRAGVLSSERFNVMKDPGKLIRVVAGLLFAENIDLGYDPTVYHRDGERFILFRHVEYKIKESHLRRVVDSWVDDSRNPFEHVIMEKITGIGGVAKIVDHETVQIRGVNDTTATDRRALSEKENWKTQRKWYLFGKLETREHRRIMMKPYGKPLEDFQTLTELLTLVKDIIQTIEDLINKRVLHRDISLRNLVLAKEDPKDPNSRRRGYIIDFDFAIETDEQDKECAKGRRTSCIGNAAFHGSGNDGQGKENKIKHAYYHDLESILYVLCWLCTAQEGPNNLQRSRDFIFKKSAIAQWAGYGKNDPTMEDIRQAKESHVSKAENFDKYIVSQFAPYFQPLRKCIKDMRTLLVFTGSADPEEVEVNRDIIKDRLKGNKKISLSVLSTIPVALRDSKAVFRSLHDVIDKTLEELATIEEPPSNAVPTHNEDQDTDELSPDQIGRKNMRAFEEENAIQREMEKAEAENAEEAKRKKKNLKKIAETVEEADEDVEDETQAASGTAHEAGEEAQDGSQAASKRAFDLSTSIWTDNVPSLIFDSNPSGAHASASLIAPESPTPTSRKRPSRDGPLNDELEELSSRKRVRSN
ncbi:hypothetical protein DFH11DRAFT_1783717 [Phellopilus nigrolimitatus]|nr:hypothetical protein DFH11DRAFT_1783717 [Phellopilus nigrolimitatus]